MVVVSRNQRQVRGDLVIRILPLEALILDHWFESSGVQSRKCRAIQIQPVQTRLESLPPIQPSGSCAVKDGSWSERHPRLTELLDHASAEIWRHAEDPV